MPAGVAVGAWLTVALGSSAAAVTAGAIAAAVVNGAIIGAVVGGITAAVTGGNIMDGVLKGGLIGGVTSGLLQGLGGLAGAESALATETSVAQQAAVNTGTPVLSSSPNVAAGASLATSSAPAAGVLTNTGVEAAKKSFWDTTAGGAVVEGASTLAASAIAGEDTSAVDAVREKHKLDQITNMPLVEGFGLTGTGALRDLTRTAGKTSTATPIAQSTQTKQSTQVGGAVNLADMSYRPSVINPQGVPNAA